MKEVKRRSFKKIILIHSLILASTLSLKAQYKLAAPTVDDGLSQSQKLLLLVQTPSKALEKFGSKQYYMPSLGQFCIWEEKFTKTAKRPIKIRLGDQDYVDKLENKGN